ncbi:MAG: hypothetical protein AAGG38_12220 [Planctomycetota bacterium]
MKKLAWMVWCVAAVGVPGAGAENIDLSTVPSRDTVQLTIYNSADLTLVRETRKVVFREGNNPLQFSWAGTLIDPTSVRLRFLSAVDKLEVLDTTYPHDKPAELTWNVGSEHAGEAVIEISYFTSGVSWSADYTVIAAADEASASIEGYVTVSNQSGEDYGDAEVRLVVGTINLVEQIADLARRAGQRPEELAPSDRRRFRADAARQSMALGDRMLGQAGAANPATPQPRRIVKQGLSEYFIFAIEGTQDVPTGLRKRLPSFKADAVPVEVVYRYRPREYGDRLARLYLMTNDKASTLGASPLPDGEVRVLRRKADGRGLSFLARQRVRYIPVGEEMELNLGVDPDVGFELVTRRVFRDNIWLKLRRPNVYYKVGEPTPRGVQVDDRSTVEGWDEHRVMLRRVRNDTGRAIRVEARQAVPGDARFISRLGAERFDVSTVVYRGEIAPGERVEAVYEVVTRQGYRAKQSRVEIVDGDPAGWGRAEVRGGG